MNENHLFHRRLVDPQTLKGFQDLLPSDMIARNAIVDKIRRVYEKYGFRPVDTPALEYLVTLIGTGGEEVNKQLFRLESPEREPIALRFDLTVPFARLIAQYPDKLKLPFRRYHVGPVFRVDKPDPGRFRQFTQFDIDIAGSDSVAADAEIIAAMCEVLHQIGLSNSAVDGAVRQEYQIRINHRKLVDALLHGSGVTNKDTQKHVLRVVDKLLKIGTDNVQKELGAGRVDESGDIIKGVGLDPSVIGQVMAFVSCLGSSRLETLAAIEKVLPKTDLSQAALQEMQDLASALESLGVGEIDAVYDPSLARGLDYYTGPVFETFLPQAPHFGSVMGGGRYDQLVERFLDTGIPATGVSIGLDRLIAALMDLGKIPIIKTTTQVFIVSMPGVPKQELLKVASELRASNISTEIYFGMEGTNMRNQLSFANANEIPVAIIIGDDELKSGQVSIKNLKVGMESRSGIKDREEYHKASKVGQQTVPRSNLVAVVKSMLEQE